MSETDFDPDGLQVAEALARRLRDHGEPVPRKRRKIVPRKKGDPAPLGDALAAVVDEQGWSSINTHLALAKWGQIVGRTVAEHAEVTGFGDSVVYVRTDSTAWAVQLRQLAPQIVAKLNAELGDGSVTRIDVKGPDAPSWKKGRRSISDARGPRDTYG